MLDRNQLVELEALRSAARPILRSMLGRRKTITPIEVQNCIRAAERPYYAALLSFEGSLRLLLGVSAALHVNDPGTALRLAARFEESPAAPDFYAFCAMGMARMAADDIAGGLRLFRLAAEWFDASRNLSIKSHMIADLSGAFSLVLPQEVALSGPVEPVEQLASATQATPYSLLIAGDPSFLSWSAEPLAASFLAHSSGGLRIVVGCRRLEEAEQLRLTSHPRVSVYWSQTPDALPEAQRVPFLQSLRYRVLPSIERSGPLLVTDADMTFPQSLDPLADRLGSADALLMSAQGANHYLPWHRYPAGIVGLAESPGGRAAANALSATAIASFARSRPSHASFDQAVLFSVLHGPSSMTIDLLEPPFPYRGVPKGGHHAASVAPVSQARH
jgi:hypothetical protein